MTTLAPSFLLDLLNFSGNEDNYNISDKFEIWPDRTKDCGVSSG